MKDSVRKQIDTRLAEIAEAIGKADWQAVARLSRGILALDPGNKTADGYLRLVQAQLETARAEPDLEQPSQSLPSSFVQGRYSVKKLLGEGARKKVYLAHDSALDRDVAFALIKTEGLDAEAKRRVTHEAQAMGKLGTHPNIVTLHDLGTDDSQQYVVMELMDRGDMADALAASGSAGLPLAQAIEVGTEVCRALSYAHARGVIHRDIKPENIWMTAEGGMKVGDFGLALSLDRSRMTRENVILGTVRYLSPEQATGAAARVR